MTRVVFFQGSARNPRGEAHQWGKTRALLEAGVATAKKLGAEVDVIDLSVTEEGDRIQPCYACISTAGGYHCHYPCDCYLREDEVGSEGEDEEEEEGETEQRDFLAENHVFDRVMAADGFILFTPVNWYSVPTQVKAMFDRFVCASLTLTREDAERVLGEGNLKNPKVTRAFEKSGRMDHLLRNHWAGKKAAFFVHGDDGADDYRDRVQPRSLRMYPDERSPVNPPEMAVMPLVQQCRYSGIEVPDEFIEAMVLNRGLDYATANDAMRERNDPFIRASRLVSRFVGAVSR